MAGLLIGEFTMSPETRILASVITLCSIVAITAIVALATNPNQAKRDKANQWGVGAAVIAIGCAITLFLIT